MKNTFLFAIFTALVASQSISDLPPCSLGCLASALTATGCAATDFSCSCHKADQVTPLVSKCVTTACPDPADQQKTFTALMGICAAAGVPVDESSSSAPAAATPSSASATPAPSAPASSTPASVPPYPTSSPAHSVPAPSGTGAANSTAPPEFSGAAVAVKAPIVAAGVLGLAAFVF